MRDKVLSTKVLKHLKNGGDCMGEVTGSTAKGFYCQKCGEHFETVPDLFGKCVVETTLMEPAWNSRFVVIGCEGAVVKAHEKEVDEKTLEQYKVLVESKLYVLENIMDRLQSFGVEEKVYKKIKCKIYDWLHEGWELGFPDVRMSNRDGTFSVPEHARSNSIRDELITIEASDSWDGHNSNGCKLCRSAEIHMSIDTQAPKDQYVFSSSPVVGLMYCPLCGRNISHLVKEYSENG